jgi:hypothetical protein
VHARSCPGGCRSPTGRMRAPRARADRDLKVPPRLVGAREPLHSLGAGRAARR